MENKERVRNNIPILTALFSALHRCSSLTDKSSFPCLQSNCTTATANNSLLETSWQYLTANALTSTAESPFWKKSKNWHRSTRFLFTRLRRLTSCRKMLFHAQKIGTNAGTWAAKPSPTKAQHFTLNTFWIGEPVSGFWTSRVLMLCHAAQK